jgi:hypothetical protein
MYSHIPSMNAMQDAPQPRNIFIFFAPGLGGNHISNLLSTDSRFGQRLAVSEYLNIKQNAHHAEVINTSIIDKLDPTANNVVCGHFGEYIWKKEYISHFVNKQALIVTLPLDRNTLASLRHEEWVTHNGYMRQEQHTLYQPQSIASMFGITDCFSIDVNELLFTSSIDDFLLFTEDHMGLKLNINDCKNMHLQWYNKIVAPLTIKIGN